MSKATDEKNVNQTEGTSAPESATVKPAENAASTTPRVDYDKKVPWTFPIDNSERSSKTITVRFKGKSYKYERGEQVMIPYKLYLMLKRKNKFARADRAYKAALEKKLNEIK